MRIIHLYRDMGLGRGQHPIKLGVLKPDVLEIATGTAKAYPDSTWCAKGRFLSFSKDFGHNLDRVPCLTLRRI